MPNSTGPIHHSDDSRVKHEFTNLNGRRYHYVIGMPLSGRKPKATVICVHGWPDTWYGWSTTIPALLELDLRVVAIDCMGYGGTEAPTVPPNSIAEYSFRRAADDIAELAKQLNSPKIVLIGHDWGAMVVHKVYNFYPQLVSHLATVSIPYAAPLPVYLPIEVLVKRLPNFAYQLALCDPQTEKDLQSKDNIRSFLRGVIRAAREGSGGKFNVPKDIVKSVANMPRSRLLSEEELEYRVDTFYRHGMHGPLNWYKTREVNFQDERSITDPKIYCPVLFVEATHDAVISKDMIEGQDPFIPILTKRSLDAAHWVMLEKPDELNAIFIEWFKNVVFGDKAKL